MMMMMMMMMMTMMIFAWERDFLLHRSLGTVGLFVDCLTSQQHASVSQGRICADNLRAATLR